jgi:hypothetical protein
MLSAAVELVSRSVDSITPREAVWTVFGGGRSGYRWTDPEQFLAARRTYYQMAGWDPDTSRPTAARLADLEVDTSVFQPA